MKTLAPLLCVLFLIILSACAAPPAQPETTTLTVMAAASLNAAFTGLGAQFEQAHPGVKVVFNFAGSQQLAQQIRQGAAADVFASADHVQMANAVASGRVKEDAIWLFAGNRLVVVTPQGNLAGVQGPGDLSHGGLKVVLAAQEVPAGRYTLQFLDQADASGAFGAGYRDAVLANVVSYEDNVRAVLTKVSLGEADAGIVYASDATGPGAPAVGVMDIPAEINVTAQYPIAALADSSHAELADAFIQFIISPDGQAVLKKYGFHPPQ